MARFWCPPLPVLVAFTLLFGLPACTTSHPYRTILNETLEPCEDISDTNSDRCKSMTPEVTKDYQLYFVEFDDQGWLHPEQDPSSGEAGRQLDFLMQNLQKKAKKSSGNPRISIVLYIHGWKHNAKYNDANLIEFRSMLKATYDMEQAAAQVEPGRTPRDVVGIYVGWRGVSLNGPDLLLDTTFWSRKAAALRVAQGTVRELFSRLNVFQHYHNEHKESDIGSTNAQKRPPGIRMILIGHSFGAWILYSAIEESLIADLSAKNDIDVTEQKPGIRRFADLIVLLNPAFEGSRYEALDRAAHHREWNTQYHAPIFVTVTSTADWATGIAFPIGRIFNTLFQRPTSSSEQGYAIGHTPGHINHYLTHTLTRNDEKTPVCDGWKAVKTVPEGEQVAQMIKNLQVEYENNTAFFNQYSSLTSPVYLTAGWQRTFCGGTVLTHLVDRDVKSDPNGAVWNVQTDSSIIKNHSDIDEVIFSSFLRQLYHDVVEFPESNN